MGMRCCILPILLLVLPLLGGVGTAKTGRLTYIYKYYDRNGNIVINNLPPGMVRDQGLILDRVTVGQVRPALTQMEFKRVLRSPELIDMVDAIALQEGVDPHLARAVIQAESAFYEKARSHAGALGLMQLMPQTAVRFGVLNPFDARQNITGGVKYLRWLWDRFKGDLDKVIAAYNAGENAVEKYKGIPPFQETRAYVPKVRDLYLGRKVQPDPRDAGKMALLQKGRGGFLVEEPKVNNRVAPALQLAQAEAQPKSRLYLWRDPSGTLNLTDYPPPAGTREIKVDD